MYIASNGIKTAVILNDPEPESPRTAYDNLGTMVCWHSRYNLGDAHNYDSIRSFKVDLAEKFVSYPEFFRLVQKDDVWQLRLTEIHPMKRVGSEIPKYMVECRDADMGEDYWTSTGCLVSEDLQRISGPELTDAEDGLLEYLDSRELSKLLSSSESIMIKPLYLYDHSGLSISIDSFMGRAHHAEWDSGQVGYIWLDKKSALENLCTPGDKVRLAQPITNKLPIRIQCEADVTPEKTLESDGYKSVHREDVVFGEDKVLYDHWLDNGNLFKKDHKLFVLEDRPPDGSFSIRPVATFNPDLLPLTEDVWKSRAFEVLESETVVYDNYLRGEVYGYETYDGNVLEDSVWGFNPGTADIRAVMSEELGYWFGQDLKFEYCSDSNFDIDDYLKKHDFPELREKLEKDVRDFVIFESETSKVYPFAMSAEEILSNKDDVLNHIVDELYSYHEEPDGTVLHDVITSHAGQARAVQPTLTVQDLDPDRDYTADELIGILKSKPSLADIILNAQCRKATEGSQKNTLTPYPDR